MDAGRHGAVSAGTRRRGRATRVVVAAAVVAVAAAVRLVPAPAVYGEDGIRFGPDSDPYYHVERARALALDREMIWRDRGINFPEGADVPWPPGLEALIAGASWIAAPSGASAETVERVATAVPVLLGIASIALAALLAREAGGGSAALATGALLALSPLHAQYSTVERPDQHAAELLLFAASALAFVRSAGATTPARGRRWALALGLALALAFWTWQGSALHVLALAAFASGWHVVAPGEDPSRLRVPSALALGNAAAAALLVTSIGLLGPPGALARGDLLGITGLAPAICFAAAAHAATLRLLARGDAPRRRRAVEAAAAALAAVLALAAFRPGLAGVRQGLEALRAASPWYAGVQEFQPLFGGASSASLDAVRIVLGIGFVPLLALAASADVRRGLRDRSGTSLPLALLAFLAVAFTALALARRRFDLYATLPLAALASAGAARLAVWIAPGRAVLARRTLLAVAAAPMIAGVVDLSRDADPTREPVIQLARWIAARDGDAGRSVLAGWDRGHEVRYYSRLPVIATPFGTEGGAQALEDAARFFVASSEAEADDVLERRRVRWVLVEPPLAQLRLAAMLLGRDPVVRLRPEAREIVPLPATLGLVSTRLYVQDGARTASAPALARFRLVAETPADDDVPAVKLFERVPGATLRVSGAEPGSPVEAVVEVRTPTQRSFAFEVHETADASGNAALRVPYASGRNGSVLVSACRVRAASGSADVEVPEDAVTGGGEVPVRLR